MPTSDVPFTITSFRVSTPNNVLPTSIRVLTLTVHSGLAASTLHSGAIVGGIVGGIIVILLGIGAF